MNVPNPGYDLWQSVWQSLPGLTNFEIQWWKVSFLRSGIRHKKIRFWAGQIPPRTHWSHVGSLPWWFFLFWSTLSSIWTTSPTPPIGNWFLSLSFAHIQRKYWNLKDKFWNNWFTSQIFCSILFLKSYRPYFFDQTNNWIGLYF